MNATRQQASNAPLDTGPSREAASGPNGGADQDPDRRQSRGRVGRPVRSRFTDGEPGLFRTASLQTQHAPFSALGSPAIYAAFATGFAWIQSWHAAQTTSVLRRIFAMRSAHAGWPDPGSPSTLRPVTW